MHCTMVCYSLSLYIFLVFPFHVGGDMYNFFSLKDQKQPWKRVLDYNYEQQPNDNDIWSLFAKTQIMEHERKTYSNLLLYGQVKMRASRHNTPVINLWKLNFSQRIFFLLIANLGNCRHFIFTLLVHA